VAEAGITLEVVAEADTKLSLLGLVAAGLGGALVSSSLATLRRPGVAYRPLRRTTRRLELGLVHLPAPAHLLRTLVELSVGACRALPS
jgi:DNA-binding transcriptional LysR family regulator